MQTKSLKINAALNMLRKGCTILFPIITFSYAAHRLGADRLGAFQFSNSVISYFLLLAALGISTYAVREGQAYRDDQDKLKTFISEVYTINVLMTLVSYLVLGLLLLFWRKLEAYTQIVLILSISIMLTTIGADWINTLLEDYLYITVRYIAIQFLCLGALITLVKGPEDIYKYACIGMFSSAGGNLLNILHIRRKIRFHLTLHPNIRRHLGPMLTLFSNNLAIKIYLLADVTILGIFMADQYVGYYSAASKVYSAVKELVNALILVTVPRFSYYIAKGNTSDYRRSYHSVLDNVCTLLFPCIIGLMFQAENVLHVLGGKEYINGTTALRILTATMLFAVFSCLFSYSILIPNKQEKSFLRATLVSAVTNFVLNLILIPLWGIEAAALTTLLSEMIVCAMTFSAGKAYMDQIFVLSGDLKSALAGSAGIAAVCVLMDMTVHSWVLNMVMSIGLSCIVYGVIIYVLKNSAARRVVSLLSRKLEKARPFV